jgi:hypothetical protein
VNFLLREIRQRWPRITYLLSGWSGASYFPNQIRYPGKNDMETGRLREQYFANNFCRFVQELKPSFAIPFASGFVLLAEENKWINLVKFPRSEVASYYNQHYSNEAKTGFLTLYPGDIVLKGVLRINSQLHKIKEKDQYALAYEHYTSEIEEVNTVQNFNPGQLAKLLVTTNYWINFNKRLYHSLVIKDIYFSVRLADCVNETYINISYNKGRLHASLSFTPLANRRVLVTTTAKKLVYAFTKVWGGDILTIGYGFTVELYDQLSLEKNLDIVCIRLITRYPIARQDLFKFPGRALRFYSHNPKLTSLWLKQKIVLKPYVNKYPFNERDHWMLYNKCALCAVCKMPEVNLEAFA